MSTKPILPPLPVEARVRSCFQAELQMIYTMGYDAWGGELNTVKYLEKCRSSPRFQGKGWFVLATASELLSSVRVKRLRPFTSHIARGLGTLATPPKLRNQGYATNLVSKMTRYLVEGQGVDIVFAFAEGPTDLFERLGYFVVSADSLRYHGATLMAWTPPSIPRRIFQLHSSSLPLFF